ncbi:hypothetical protein [Streptomyces albidus (ex Kaewkla and Franco 2022)]|uniref:nSTAND1 domain-containing NTPase n=1 Tax=Streptomyces albidus (ex Kaewkla and Franco 2022) TaxID=722709 RepID=UPI0015EF4395|nr:hypothetical protein [Streptomyces albidus (ex Kaewkla and Franco 2022)]
MPRKELPLAAGDGALLSFAADLRRLRHDAGSPSYRALSGRAHFSIATLSGAASGRRLPSLEVALAYVRACGGDTDRWEQRWRDVAAEVAAEAAAERDADEEGTESSEGAERAPYAGLAAFQAADSEWFFGRERLVEDLVDRVATQRIVALFGASGAGKSSLLRAGLLPRLRSANRTVLLFTPGPHPLEELAILLASAANSTPGRLNNDFADEPQNVHRTLRQIAADREADAEFVLVVDQFEELFTVCTDREERAAFISALVFAARTANSRCRVILGVRADFYSHCAQEPELVEALRDAQITVGPMNADELHRAIVQPAARSGCRVEGQLLTHLVAHAQGQAAVLPLLSHALLETWRRRRGNQLTLAGFRAAGAVEGSLAQSAEAFYGKLAPQQRVVARQLFLRLTALGEGTEDTKRRISRTELDVDEDTGVVLERAAAARLITLDEQRLEVTHEALIRGWPRLRAWLADSRQELRTHRQLTEAAGTWESLGRDPGALYRGARLTVARQAAQSGCLGLTVHESAFLEASTEAESAEAATAHRRSRRLRVLVVSLALLLVATTAMTVYATRANREVTRQRNSAVAKNTAAAATGLVPKKPATAIQLALAAYRLAPARGTRDRLLSTLMPSWNGHRGELLSLAIRPGGRTMATGGGDGKVRLWDVHKPRSAEQLSVLNGHKGTVYAVEMRRDGHVLATAGSDRTIRLWGVADPEHPALLSTTRSHTADVRSLAFSPDGRTLASSGNDRTTRLWDIEDPEHPDRLAVLRGHEDTVRSVAFNRDGRTLATAGDDETVQLWDVADPGSPDRLARRRAHDLGVFDVAFSPTSDVLATSGGGEQPAKLWSIKNPRQPRELAALSGHSDVVGALAFSPDGRAVASAGDDRTVRSWDISDPEHPRRQVTLTGYTTAVAAVRYSPDGTTLVSGVFDGRVRMLPVDLRRVVRGACDVTGRAISRAVWERHLPGIPYDPPCR